MVTRDVRWGGLDAQLIEPRRPEEAVLNVVLSHGFGAPGDDLVPLAPLLLKFAPELAERVRIIFPAAPLDLEPLGMPGGRAWWHIDMLRLQAAVATGAYRDMSDETPEGLSPARERMFQFLRDCEDDTGLSLSQTVLGGFSQGAMLSTDVMLHLPLPIAGLVILSGTLINQAEWRKRLAQRAGVPVFQSHGTHDPILPFDLSVQLRDELQAAGNRVDFYQFAGAHEIPFEAMQGVSRFLAERLRLAESGPF